MLIEVAFDGGLQADDGVEAAAPDALAGQRREERHPKVKAWLARHPRWTFHFTPTSGSWLNAVETLVSGVVVDAMASITFPVGTSRSTVLRKRMNSGCR